MKKLWTVMTFLLIWSCSSGPKAELNEDYLNDVLISFTYNSQASRWDDVLALVTYEEQLQMLDAQGNLKNEYQTAMKRLKISILQKEELQLDYKGRLVGIVKVLEESNRRFLISDEQRSINLNSIDKTTWQGAGSSSSAAESAENNITDTSEAYGDDEVADDHGTDDEVADDHGTDDEVADDYSSSASDEDTEETADNETEYSDDDFQD